MMVNVIACSNGRALGEQPEPGYVRALHEPAAYG